MKIQTEREKQLLINRLNRLEGQVRGINRMIAEERECGEVLQQMTAARSALQAALQSYIEHMVNHCLLADEIDSEERRRLAGEMLSAIHKT